MGPGYIPSSGPSDCANINGNYTQYVRTAANQTNNPGHISSHGQTKTDLFSDTQSKRDEKLTVYPNPAQNELNIAGLHDIHKIELQNATMQTIQIISGNQTKLDISTLESGMYFLRIYCGNNIKISKFTKQ